MSGGPELISIINSIALEKDIDPEILYESIEAAMIAAARRKYEEALELDVVIDRTNGAIVGTYDGKPMDTATLGRIAAQTAKQVLVQKIREVEQDNKFDEFEARKGELLSGTVQRFEGENVIVDLNKSEALLPRHERVRTETFHVGDRIRVALADVRRVGHRVRLIVSRTHPDLVRRLFELEIPEIGEHIIEIKAIAREAGFRTKLAVVSYDTKVDCVGACVGIRGSRIRNIIDELNGEKIDIIRWSESPEVLIMNALKPAEIQSIELNDETNEAVVTVEEDMMSLAIGKRGQNVRLAARLTGWDVNILGAGGVIPKSAHPSDRSTMAGSLTGGATTEAALSPEEQLLLDEMRSEASESAGEEPTEIASSPAEEAAEAQVEEAPAEEAAEAQVEEAPAEEAVEAQVEEAPAEEAAEAQVEEAPAEEAAEAQVEEAPADGEDAQALASPEAAGSEETIRPEGGE